MKNHLLTLLIVFASVLFWATSSFAAVNTPFFGRYNLHFTISECIEHTFTLVLGDDLSLVNGFGGDPDLPEYYVYIPALGSSASYSFIDSEGDHLERTISITGNTLTMDEELEGYYTGHFVFTFSSDLNSFNIRGSVTEQELEECQGVVNGTGTRIGTPPCKCDLNTDGRCDNSDLLLFRQQWGATNCNTVPCPCDLNADGRCDMWDWLLFGKSWGRTDCPIQ